MTALSCFSWPTPSKWVWEGDAGGERALEDARGKRAAYNSTVTAGDRPDVPSLAPGLVVALDL
ncbi:hypothetical protein [Arthrobacter sp. lap29]|uniref:hypothetical protein n=1 Tax=Arthrobacter sp. lap29 TaxID=3056122 RepID=UPI0028F6E0E5|nr:hypothetical protein [Arthrobacter sp. lap29]